VLTVAVAPGLGGPSGAFAGKTAGSPRPLSLGLPKRHGIAEIGNVSGGAPRLVRRCPSTRFSTISEP
jgi:hypothetical protein